MNKFTVEQVERCLARREYELVVVKRHQGPEFVPNPHYDEINAMLRAFAARLREDDENAKDAARYRWRRSANDDGHSVYCATDHIESDGQSILELLGGNELDVAIDAAMREQGEG